MATLITRSTTTSYTDIESMFDLDTVLSGADDFLYFDQTLAPACSLVVSALPTVVVGVDVDVDVDICTVCMEDFRSDEIGKRIPCGHIYHENCISSWLSVGDCCPLCRCRVAGEKTDASKSLQLV